MEKKNITLIIIYALLGYCVIASLILIIYCNPNYREKELITNNDMKIQVEQSFITSYNDYNEIMSRSQNFLIVNIQTNLSKDNLFLKINNNYYRNNNEYQEYFKDFGNNYLIYIINNEDLGKDMFLYFKYKEKYVTRNYSIHLQPIDLNEANNPIEYHLNDEISINNIKTKIISYDIKDEFIISYKEQNKNINRIIKQKDHDILKINISGIKNIDQIEKYISLKYTLNNEEKDSSISLIKDSIIENNIYFIIDKDVRKAETIWLSFMSRNQKYEYYLKRTK